MKYFFLHTEENKFESRVYQLDFIDSFKCAHNKLEEKKKKKKTISAWHFLSLRFFFSSFSSFNWKCILNWLSAWLRFYEMLLCYDKLLHEVSKWLAGHFASAFNEQFSFQWLHISYSNLIRLFEHFNVKSRHITHRKWVVGIQE